MNMIVILESWWKLSCPVLQYCPSIFFEGLRKTTEIYQVNQSPCQGSYWDLLDMKQGC